MAQPINIRSYMGEFIFHLEGLFWLSSLRTSLVVSNGGFGRPLLLWSLVDEEH
jgi:hypothetical protein